jgi:hypothetical protein
MKKKYKLLKSNNNSNGYWGNEPFSVFPSEFDFEKELSNFDADYIFSNYGINKDVLRDFILLKKLCEKNGDKIELVNGKQNSVFIKDIEHFFYPKQHKVFPFKKIMCVSLMNNKPILDVLITYKAFELRFTIEQKFLEKLEEFLDYIFDYNNPYI